MPFTRNCLKDKKVRKELGQQKADEQLENLQRRYDLLVDSFEGDGFNAGIFDLEILTAAHVIRAETRTSMRRSWSRIEKPSPPLGNGTTASQESATQASPLELRRCSSS